MAIARKVKLTVREVKRVDRIQLTLTDGEADFLIAVLARVGGSPTHSPRKYGQRIAAVLEKATGSRYMDTDAFRLVSGGMHFGNYETDEFLKSRGRIRS